MDIFAFKPDYNNIYICGPCLEEEQVLYKKDRATAKKYERWLDRQLRFLDKEGLRVIGTHPKSFEKLSETSVDLFCIRQITNVKNPRILFFAIIEADEDPAFVLLTAFHELNQGDYDRAINRAETRRKMILKALGEDGASS